MVGCLQSGVYSQARGENQAKLLLSCWQSHRGQWIAYKWCKIPHLQGTVGHKTHAINSFFLPDPIARINVGDAQFPQAMDAFELYTSIGCNCTISSFFFSMFCCDDIAFMVWCQFWHEDHLVSSWKRSCFGRNYLLWLPQIWKPFIDLTTAQNLLGFHFSKSGINGIKSDQRINGAHIPIWFSQLCIFSVFTN